MSFSCCFDDYSFMLLLKRMFCICLVGTFGLYHCSSQLERYWTACSQELWALPVRWDQKTLSKVLKPRVRQTLLITPRAKPVLGREHSCAIWICKCDGLLTLTSYFFKVDRGFLLWDTVSYSRHVNKDLNSSLTTYYICDMNSLLNLSVAISVCKMGIM